MTESSLILATESTCWSMIWWSLNLKSVEEISRIHVAQVLSYMKLSKKQLGLIINFNVLRLKDGIKRLVEGTGWK